MRLERGHGVAAAKKVRVTDQSLIVELTDGRAVWVPLRWYRRLEEGSHVERRRWELTGLGVGIHWPGLDEDISVEGLLRGLPSGESAASLDRWRDSRKGRSSTSVRTRRASQTARKRRARTTRS
jgi:hypothetical protein